jgi:hypothetical protein
MSKKVYVLAYNKTETLVFEATKIESFMWSVRAKSRIYTFVARDWNQAKKYHDQFMGGD